MKIKIVITADTESDEMNVCIDDGGGFPYVCEDEEQIKMAMELVKDIVEKEGEII
jgi:two-component sensor histidine kinase